MTTRKDESISKDKKMEALESSSHPPAEYEPSNGSLMAPQNGVVVPMIHLHFPLSFEGDASATYEQPAVLVLQNVAKECHVFYLCESEIEAVQFIRDLSDLSQNTPELFGLHISRLNGNDLTSFLGRLPSQIIRLPMALRVVTKKQSSGSASI